MRRIKIFFILAGVCFVFCACPENNEGHRYIAIVNTSERNIRVQELWSGSIVFDDSVYQCRIRTFLGVRDSSIIFKSSSEKGWETDFQFIPFYQLLVFDNEAFERYALPNYDCDSIRKYVPVLHCYRLTLEDLERMNWTIIYPPE